MAETSVGKNKKEDKGALGDSMDDSYHLEAEENINNYNRWRRYQSSSEHIQKAYGKTRFSVVIPVYNTITEQLTACIDSVLAQTYSNFELILVDDHSSWENVVSVLKRYEKREHVQVIYRQENGHISKATNDGISVSTGDFIVFMDCDDTVEPTALEEFAWKLHENPELDFIYSDEDKLTEDGRIYHMPFFKPDWSPDLFLNMMYTNHLAAYRTTLVKEVGGLRSAYNGSQDYDFTLRFMECSDNRRVGHIPKILYHWRERKESVALSLDAKNYAAEAAKRAKEDYIRRNRLDAELGYIPVMSQYRIIYHVMGIPLVSIIIPSRDHPDILKQCIDSIRAVTRYQNYEIIVVDNGSTEANKKQVQEYLDFAGAEYIYEKAEFNFSRMCNMGAASARGEYLLFLNDDIEIFQPEWIERMLGQAQQKHTGAVGAKLFYPNTTRIQHGGVCNAKDGPTHNFLQCDDRDAHYFGLNWVDYNCIAVTGACLMLARDKFEEVGRFDERFPVAYNDVRLCFALHKKGYYHVMRNDVTAYHHESLSRGNDLIDREKLLRLNKERLSLYADFPELKDRDPYLNENLREMSSGLKLWNTYAEITEMDLSDCRPLTKAIVDAIQVTDHLYICGWCILEQEPHIEELERYLVFEDPYGNHYGAPGVSKKRLDVEDFFNNPDYQMAGFESIMRKNVLRLDLMTYRVGMLVIGRDKKRYLKWCRDTEIIQNMNLNSPVIRNDRIESLVLHDGSTEVQWYVDACSHQADYWRIAGFAFKKGGDHYQYTSTLILACDDGTAYELNTEIHERLDVACTFPKEHFLYKTGFAAYAFDCALEAGKEYKVIIRLTNQFRPTEFYDVVTGKMIKS